MTEIVGRVIPGKKEGRKLGFPTANLSIENAGSVQHGVYAAWVAYDGVWYRAVANVGVHPTLPEGLPTVEVHILDNAIDLYGKTVRLVLGQYIRPEKKFDSVDALKAQIRQDIAFVRDLEKPEA